MNETFSWRASRRVPYSGETAVVSVSVLSNQPLDTEKLEAFLDVLAERGLTHITDATEPERVVERLAESLRNTFTEAKIVECTLRLRSIEVSCSKG